MTLQPVREIARGRWRSILPHFGIDGKALSGKQGPCPMCGGKTKFRFDDKEGRGTWICNSVSCGAGDGVMLVMALTGMPFSDAAKRIEELAGAASAVPARADRSDEDKRRANIEMWQSTSAVVPGDPVDLYLRSRLGEVVVPPVLRHLARCRYQDDPVSYHPAMIAKVTDIEGNGVTLHRTYLTQDGRKADVPVERRNMAGSIPDGSAVRLMQPGPVLGISEGIENALAAAKLFGIPVWSALNEVMLGKWRPPAGVGKVVVFGDNDVNLVGQSSAYLLGRRLIEHGIPATVELPDLIPGRAKTDWNDALIQAGRNIAQHETRSAA